MDIRAAGMSRTELKFEYDTKSRPISATCGTCGEKMPDAPAQIDQAADRIMWLSERYIEHRKLKHSSEDRRRMPRD